jgi:hypothetical protein
MVDSIQNTNNDFGAFKDTRILMGGADFQIENGLDRIVFQGKLEIGRNQASRNILRDLIGVLTTIRDAIPETAHVNDELLAACQQAFDRSCHRRSQAIEWTRQDQSVHEALKTAIAIRESTNTQNGQGATP